jgi:hypothetical protein
MCLATCRTWILPSSRQLGFLHLIIHVRYVKRQIMLIKCYFAIIVMVDTISSTSSSYQHFVLFIMFSCNTLIFTQTMPCFSWLRFWGDTWKFHLSLLLCIVYICVCISFWLMSFYLWLVLIFSFSRVYYGLRPLRHHTSRHYTSRQLDIIQS